MNAIEKYFTGEKIQCTVGIVLSILLIGLALYFLLVNKTELLKGVAYPLLIVALALSAICTAIVIRSPKDIQRVNEMLLNQPDKLKTEEIPRMEQVMKNFKKIKTIEIVLGAIGLCLLLFAPTFSQWKGVGLGLAIMAIIMYLFDHFAESRGNIYMDYLQSI